MATLLGTDRVGNIVECWLPPHPSRVMHGPMVTDSEFPTLAHRTLDQLRERYEPAFENEELDELELQNGVLTFATSTGKTFIVSAHAPSREIWLASPISGGLHFAWNGEHWALKSGELLEVIVRQELGREGVLAYD